MFQAGIKDASIRDHQALHAGRLNFFDEKAIEVSTVARTRNENDIVPVDVSVTKGKGGIGKDGKDGKKRMEGEDESQGWQGQDRCQVECQQGQEVFLL